jgi:hypothetical protein
VAKSFSVVFFRAIRVIRGRISARIGQIRPGFGMARKKRAVFGKKWQKMAERYSLGQFGAGAKFPAPGRQKSYEK